MATSPTSSPLHARSFESRTQARSTGGGDGSSVASAPATHDLASISIQPPAGAPLQRVSWWTKARKRAAGAGAYLLDRANDAGTYLRDTARDSGTLAKTGVSATLGAAGALAYGGAAALTGSVLAPAALGGAAVYGAYRGLDYLLSPQAPPEAAQLKLPKERFTERPDKTAKSLKGGGLTAHHKIPFNHIRDTINDATGNSWSSLIPGRQATARANLATWGSRGPKTEVGTKALTWTPHNIFMGPLAENRDDDPNEALDTHFTASGTVTPRSELALDITHAGGLGRIDPKVLEQRLAKLAAERSQPSAHDPHEWQGTPDHQTQTAQPPGWQNLSTREKVNAVARKRARKKGGKGKKNK